MSCWPCAIQTASKARGGMRQANRAGENTCKQMGPLNLKTTLNEIITCLLSEIGTRLLRCLKLIDQERFSISNWKSNQFPFFTKTPSRWEWFGTVRIQVTRSNALLERFTERQANYLCNEQLQNLSREILSYRKLEQ